MVRRKYVCLKRVESGQRHRRYSSEYSAPCFGFVENWSDSIARPGIRHPLERVVAGFPWWEAPSVRGELLSLDIEVSARTASRGVRQRRKPDGWQASSHEANLLKESQSKKCSRFRSPILTDSTDTAQLDVVGHQRTDACDSIVSDWSACFPIMPLPVPGSEL